MVLYVVVAAAAAKAALAARPPTAPTRRLKQQVAVGSTSSLKKMGCLSARKLGASTNWQDD